MIWLTWSSSSVSSQDTVEIVSVDADSAAIVEQHPNLHLSPEERRLFGQLFTAADSEKIGVVTGEVAVKFFEKTRLAPDVLGEVGAIQEDGIS